MIIKSSSSKRLCAALAIACTSLVSAEAYAATNMSLSVNRSEVLMLDKAVQEVIVDDPQIADVVVHSASRISIMAKAIGSTKVKLIGRNNQIVRDINITVGYDLPNIRMAIANFFPDENVGVQMVNDNIALTGIVSDAQTAASIIQVINEYVNTDRGSDPGDDPDVLNLAKIRSGQQVMLRVRIGEVKRTTVKRLGANLNAFRNVGNFVFGLGSGAGGLTDPLVGGLSSLSYNASQSMGAIGATWQTSNGGVGGVIEALERDGLLKVLAEPNLIAISGEKAEFLAGGEYPVPVDAGDGVTSVQFKPYGVSLQFIPFVLSENRIRMKVAPEVSEIDTASGISVGDVRGVTTRRVETTIELAPGETFMIAGLIQDRIDTSVDEVPGVAEVPIISALFRETTFDRTEDELVVAVTPYLVDPIAHNDLRMPTDNFRPASLLESHFYGALGTLQGDTTRISQTPTVEGPIGFLVD